MFSPLKKQTVQFSNPVKYPISSMSDEEFQEALDKTSNDSLRKQMLQIRMIHLQEMGLEFDQQSIMLQPYSSAPSPSAQ